MYLKDVSHVLFFNVSENVNEPLKVLVRRTNPQKVNLKKQMKIKFKGQKNNYLINILFLNVCLLFCKQHQSID